MAEPGSAYCSRTVTFSTIELMSLMLSPVLIGRKAELDALVSALDRAGAGAGSALFMTGDPGIGKSRLASEISSLASARGFAVHRSRAVQSPSPLPFGPVTEALREALRTGSLDDVSAGSPYQYVLAALEPEIGRASCRERV